MNIALSVCLNDMVLWLLLLARHLEACQNTNGVRPVDFTNISDFVSVVKSRFFVDKTLLIKEFLLISDNILITAPRGFGKSTSLDMIRRFCECEVDNKGKLTSKQMSENFKIFTKKYHKNSREEELEIFKEMNFFNAHFGQYPLIYLDFNELNGENFDDFVKSFQYMVNKEFTRHNYLLESDLLEDEEKNEFDMYYTMDSMLKVRQIELEWSIRQLSQFLHLHFNKRVIVLIDNYDSPIKQFIFQSGSDFNKTEQLMKGFISDLLKANYHVISSLVTSCLSLDLDRPLSGENKIRYYRFTDRHVFSKYYGFREWEVADLAERFGLIGDLRHAREWYRTGSSVYNMRSVGRWLQSGQYNSYRTGLDYTKQLVNLCSNAELHSKIMSLVRNETVEITPINRLSVEHIIFLRNAVANHTNVNVSDDINIVLNVMLELGFFTVVKKYVEKEAGYYILISNKEVAANIKNNLMR